MHAHPLPGVFQAIAPLLDHYGYLAVAALLFLTNLGSPVTLGATIFLAAAIYAGAGRLNIAIVMVIGVVASVAGSAAGYAIGRLGGRALVLRFGRYVFLTSERLAKGEEFFVRHGALVLVFARFFGGLRQAAGIISGITEMPLVRFLLYNTLGAILWIGVWGSLGYLAGNHIAAIYQQVIRYTLYIVIGLAVIVFALVLGYGMRHPPADPDGPPPGADES
jgi:membrane protein DedA with SNARE-associated domain